MDIIEAVKAAMEAGKPVCREAWGKQAKIFVDGGQLLRPGRWEDDEPVEGAMWSPRTGDILEDDWELADG